MSHNLYAEIDSRIEQLYYDDRDQYQFEKPPSIGVKVIRSSDWLPAHLCDAVWEDFTPNQARMYADALQRQVGSHVFREAGSEEARRIIDIALWLHYWADHDVGINGGP